MQEYFGNRDFLRMQWRLSEMIYLLENILSASHTLKLKIFMFNLSPNQLIESSLKWSFILKWLRFWLCFKWSIWTVLERSLVKIWASFSHSKSVLTYKESEIHVSRICYLAIWKSCHAHIASHRIYLLTTVKNRCITFTLFISSWVVIYP